MTSTDAWIDLLCAKVEASLAEDLLELDPEELTRSDIEAALPGLSEHHLSIAWDFVEGFPAVK
jgi:hypothetical protein